MRDDHLRLNDIIEAIQLIQMFCAGRTRADLLNDRLLQSAVLHQLFVIGESASRVTDTLKARHPSVPWKIIYGFRNHIAHEYFALDLNIVWQTISYDLPELKSQIAGISRIEYPA